MESEILYLLGVKPVWNSGRVVDVELFQWRHWEGQELMW
nr:hypothetical protein [Methanosarcina barkeri]